MAHIGLTRPCTSPPTPSSLPPLFYISRTSIKRQNSDRTDSLYLKIFLCVHHWLLFSLIHRPRRMTVPFLRQLYYPVCTSWMKAYLTIVLYCVSPIRIGNTIVSTTTTVCSMGFPIRKREVYLYAVSTLRKGRKR